MAPTTKQQLPKFWEVAEARLPGSSKTVNIKVSKATCEMMIEAERAQEAAYRQVVKTSKAYMESVAHARTCDDADCVTSGQSVWDMVAITEQTLQDALAEATQP